MKLSILSQWHAFFSKAAPPHQIAPPSRQQVLKYLALRGTVLIQTITINKNHSNSHILDISVIPETAFWLMLAKPYNFCHILVVYRRRGTYIASQTFSWLSNSRSPLRNFSRSPLRNVSIVVNQSPTDNIISPSCFLWLLLFCER